MYAQSISSLKVSYPSFTILDYTSEDFSVDIRGPREPYEFTYEIGNTTGLSVGQETQGFSIKLTMLSSLLGGNREMLVLKFNRPSVIEDRSGNLLITQETSADFRFALQALTPEQQKAA